LVDTTFSLCKAFKIIKINLNKNQVKQQS